MEPILEPDDVDFVISSGRWSPEVVAEVAEFFRQSHDELQSLPINDLNPAPRNDPTDPLREENVPMAAKV